MVDIRTISVELYDESDILDDILEVNQMPVCCDIDAHMWEQMDVQPYCQAQSKLKLKLTATSS